MSDSSRGDELLIRLPGETPFIEFFYLDDRVKSAAVVEATMPILRAVEMNADIKKFANDVERRLAPDLTSQTVFDISLIRTALQVRCETTFSDFLMESIYTVADKTVNIQPFSAFDISWAEFRGWARVFDAFIGVTATFIPIP